MMNDILTKQALKICLLVDVGGATKSGPGEFLILCFTVFLGVGVFGTASRMFSISRRDVLPTIVTFASFPWINYERRHLFMGSSWEARPRVQPTGSQRRKKKIFLCRHSSAAGGQGSQPRSLITREKKVQLNWFKTRPPRTFKLINVIKQVVKTMLQRRWREGVNEVKPLIGRGVTLSQLLTGTRLIHLNGHRRWIQTQTLAF